MVGCVRLKRPTGVGELLRCLQAEGYNAICVASLEEQAWTPVVTHEAEWQFLFQAAGESRSVPE